MTESIIGTLPPPAQYPERTAWYETVRLEESHELGADGRPARHRTVQTIRALIDGVSAHQYAFDLGQARVDCVAGGTPGDLHRIKGNLWAVDLRLPRTLHRGDQHVLEYVTRFRSEELVPPRFRRAVHRRVEQATLQVTFHPDTLPREVWWTLWEDYRDPHDRVIEQTPVELDEAHSVQRRIGMVERAVVGFSWQF